MPHKHKIKQYRVNGYYHAYNRGVEKRVVFNDDQDYRVFLHLLKFYLSPPPADNKHPFSDRKIVSLIRPRPLANLHKEVDLLAYCLMPNHFHLLLQQKPIDGMQKLMRRLLTTYAMYFNRRNNRVGYLFQGSYKAVLVDSDEYLLHLSRYIHLNPSELTRTVLVSDYPYSSYQYYLRKKKAGWLKQDIILDYFKSGKKFPLYTKYRSYEKYVDEYFEVAESSVGMLTID